MEFGKIAQVDNIDFTFPDTEIQNIEILQEKPRLNQPTVYIGTTGWGNPEWVGSYYAHKNPKTFLEAYAQQCNTVELNTSFYRIPPASFITKWNDNTPEDFKFCPKAFKPISHGIHSSKAFSYMDSFLEAFTALNNKLGPLFIQFPERMSKESITTVLKFLETYHKDCEIAIELRHSSWYQNVQYSIELAQILSSLDVIWLMTDVAGRRDVLPMLLTTSKAMIRFVGNELHPTDYSRIVQWAEKIIFWLNNGIQEVYFFVHQPSSLNSPELMTILEERIKDAIDVKIRSPKKLDSGMEQLTLF